MPLHFSMDEGLSLEESGMAVQTLPLAFGISSLSIANLRAGQFRAPVVQGSSKAQVLHTGHRGRKTLWSKLILVKASGLNLGHFHLLISGLGAINISLRFALFLGRDFTFTMKGSYEEIQEISKGPHSRPGSSETARFHYIKHSQPRLLMTLPKERFFCCVRFPYGW